MLQWQRSEWPMCGPVPDTVSRLSEKLSGHHRSEVAVHVWRRYDTGAGRQFNESDRIQYACGRFYQSDSIAVRVHVAGKFFFSTFRLIE